MTGCGGCRVVGLWGCRVVGQLPIDKLPPGVYELKATITVSDRTIVRTAVFTVIP
jgi:hypothetical protein